MDMQRHREVLQLRTQADWANREYAELMSGSIKRMADFLNAFHLSCSSRLADLNSRLALMERQLRLLESKVDRRRVGQQGGETNPEEPLDEDAASLAEDQSLA